MIIKENLPMKKIINTFKFGEKKVKRSLALAILSALVTVSFAVLALVLSNMLCFFVAIVAGFVTISLIQTFMIAEGENPTVVKPVGDAGTDSYVHMEFSSNDSVADPKKAKKKKVKKQKNSKGKKSKNQALDIETKETQSTELQGELDMAKLLNRQTDTVNNQLAYDESLDEIESDDDVEENSIIKKFKVITAATAETYTKKKIKKTLHKYKVIKDHRMVIVDRSDKYRIYQTPAYVWVQENQFHILLIEEEPRLLMIPIFRITEISYLKKQPAEPEKDYSLFKKSTILTESFRPYLPDYNQSNKTTDLTSYKNLYGITQGIYFTNNSAKNLFELLGVDFYVEDKVTTSNKVNIFFKEAYKANIKLRDNVLDANGYADSITKTLDDMAHSAISYAEFKDTLNLMTKNKLITDEYANHYMDVRNGLSG